MPRENDFMKYFIAVTLSILQLSNLLIFSETSYAALAIPITASSAILMDNASGQVLYAKTPFLKRAPASTTKILTALVAMERLSLDQVVTIPPFVTSIEPSKANLIPGERYYVKDLLRATLISSANDAAETLGYYAGGGSRSRFADLMNEKIQSLGGKRSHFIRSSGLPAPNQYSTAYDMTLVMREARRYPFIEETMKIKTTNIASLAGRQIYLKNHNKMLWGSKEGQRQVLGKTGWTRNAKHCFVGVINAYNRSVFVALLGSRKLWKDLARLVDSQFGTSLSGTAPPTLKLWSKKERVIRIQEALKKVKLYDGPSDGKYNSKTRAGIKQFQKAHKLPLTGRVGPRTLRLLKSYF